MLAHGPLVIYEAGDLVFLALLVAPEGMRPIRERELSHDVIVEHAGQAAADARAIVAEHCTDSFYTVANPFIETVLYPINRYLRTWHQHAISSRKCGTTSLRTYDVSLHEVLYC